MEKAKVRKMMLEVMEAYLEALIEKNEAAVDVTENCRVTYNGKECKLGANELWKNTLVITERQTFVDPDTKEMIFFGIMTNETRDRNQDFPVAVSVYVKQYLTTIRLKVTEDGKISEVEELTTQGRYRNFYSDIDSIKLPALEFEMVVPEDERSTKEELITLVSDYWDAAAKWKPESVLKIHPDAQRFENGYRTTNHSYSFRGDYKHNESFVWETPYASRAYSVVDPVRGVVVSSCFMENGAGANRDGLRGARIIEAFKIKDGLICSLLAFFPVLEGLSGWEKE